MASMNPLDAAARVRTLRALARAGVISPVAAEAGARRLRGDAAWRAWAARTLLVVGTPLVLAGILFFFAYNWSGLSRGAKLALTQAGLIGCVVAAAAQRADRLGARLGLLAAMVMVGVCLAVFGQAYQTGADAYELFLGWALLITGWVILADWTGAWLLWLGLWNTALVLYWNQVLSVGRAWADGWLFTILAVLNGVALAITELNQRRHESSPRRRWFPELLWAATLTAVTIPLFAVITGLSHDPPIPWFGLWLMGVVSGYVVYRVFIFDMPALALTCGSVAVIVAAALGRAMLPGGDVGIWLVYCLMLVGLVAALVGVLRWLGRPGGSEHPGQSS